MIERLFVYGTLGPGQPNEHLLTSIGGSWEPAAVTGTLRRWGAALGYPGIELDERGDRVEGFIFSSDNLSSHWSALDDFEGEAYERVLTKVKRKDVDTVEAYVYALRNGENG